MEGSASGPSRDSEMAACTLRASLASPQIRLARETIILAPRLWGESELATVINFVPSTRK